MRSVIGSFWKIRPNKTANGVSVANKTAAAVACMKDCDQVCTKKAKKVANMAVKSIEIQTEVSGTHSKPTITAQIEQTIDVVRI